MNYLLDTHAVLWVTESFPRLSARVRALVENHDADAFGISAITLVEIAQLAHHGDIDLSPDPADWLEDLGHRFSVLPISPSLAWRGASLDWLHKDPADRLICATALEHKLTLITHDKEITRWGGVPVVW